MSFGGHLIIIHRRGPGNALTTKLNTENLCLTGTVRGGFNSMTTNVGEEPLHIKCDDCGLVERAAHRRIGVRYPEIRTVGAEDLSQVTYAVIGSLRQAVIPPYMSQPATPIHGLIEGYQLISMCFCCGSPDQHAIRSNTLSICENCWDVTFFNNFGGRTGENKGFDRELLCTRQLRPRQEDRFERTCW